MELKNSLKELYCIQDSTSDRSVLIKAASCIQNSYNTVCNLQNDVNNLKKRLEEITGEKEDQTRSNSELSKNYEQCKEHLKETKLQLIDISQKLATVQKREENLYLSEQINVKFKEFLRVILQDTYTLLNYSNKKENDVEILKNKLNELHKIEKEAVSQAKIAGTLQASPNPLLSEIGEGVIYKFVTFAENFNLSQDVASETSENDCEIRELRMALQKQDQLIENYARQQEELFNSYNELTSKLAEHESIKYDLTQKINMLEKSEQDLVEKNLKLYIDYVSAKEEVQKLLIELENRQEFLSSGSSRGVHEDSVQSAEIKRTLSEESDPLGTMTSEDEGLGEERRGDSTGPSSLADLQESEEDILNRTSDFESETVEDHNLDLEISQNSLLEMGIDTQEFMEHQKMKSEWKKEMDRLREREKELTKQLNCSQNLISKLYKSIKVKEEQVRKLLQENCTRNHENCQEQELKSKLAYVQNDLVNLQERLALSEEDKMSLKEQLLELEEAENDARLTSQRLQEKLNLAAEKENQLLSQLEKLKNLPGESFNRSEYQDMTRNELVSQIGYMAVLIQKYEDHIQTLETSKLNLQQRVCCLEQLLKSAEALTSAFNNRMDVKEEFALPNELYKKASVGLAVSTQTDFNTDNICAFCNSFVIPPEIPKLSESSTPVQQELLQRLHVLEKEDQTLREQLHQMDGMNLALWKKLHKLEAHVGKCLKKYTMEYFLDDGPSQGLSELLELNENEKVCGEKQSCSVDDGPSLLPGANPDQHILQRILSLESSEQKLKERLLQLECINHEFEKELEIRERLYKEKEIQQQKWLEIENSFKETIKNLENEKMCLHNKVLVLEEEKLQLHKNINNLQSELEALKSNHDKSLKELELNRQKALIQLEKKQQNFGALEAKQVQRMTELEYEQKSIGITSKTFEIDLEKYNLITCELEMLKKDHRVLKESAKKNKEEIKMLTKDFEFQFDMLNKLQRSKEEKLNSEIDHLLSKERDYNSKIIEMLEKQAILEQELLSKESELEQTKKEFQHQMKMLEEEHHVIEAELKWKLKEMEENAAITVKALKEEKKRLENDLQADLEDLHAKEEAYKLRISELESFVEQLRKEANQITDANGSKCKEEKLGVQSENVLLLQKLSEFQKNEKELKEKLIDMEKKEEAYKETLEHAEKIIATLEKDYNEKIDELESSERSLKLRINQLEEVENCLHCTLDKEKRMSEFRKSNNLIEELLESEMREAALKEQILDLESNQRNLLQKLHEMDKNKKYLQEELGNHEEMICTVEKLQQQVEFLKKELISVQNSEKALQETLQQADDILIQKEEDLKQDLMRVEEEKKELEETILQLRKQVKELESMLEKSEFEKLSFGEHLYHTVVNSDIEEEFVQKTRSGNLQTYEDRQKAENIGTELNSRKSITRDDENNPYSLCVEFNNVGRLQIETLSDMCQRVLGRCQNSTREEPRPLGRTDSYFDEVEEDGGDDLNFGWTSPELDTCRSEVDGISPVTWSRTPGIVSLEDLTTGLEAQLQLEQCVLRAVASMEREMQLKEASKILPDDTISGNNDTLRTENVDMDDSGVTSTNDLTSKSEITTVQIELHQQQSANPLPPSNFCILRQIGNHSLLVGWTTPKEGCQIGGYQIYVEGKLHQKVRSPECNKAILSKLNVFQPLNIGIYSISTSGHTSEPVFAFHPGSLQLAINNNNVPFMCRTEHSCVLRIYGEDNECREFSVQKGSNVLVTGVPDDDGFCTVKIENQEGKLPFSVLKEVENYCFDQQ
ncbi:putative leucine-rich repeat-containing protein DDB_G0290503 [Centruroides vittatus]|uniref:putative leucine-rich repeat-containing protein DDB_G0290503 n=1 Tax=Centruroides vittatus TaxID=120091 RepID=UPI00350FC74B